MERFETLYPVDSRKKEIEQIFRFVTKGQSCQLISVPGAGRSTVLRLLAYNGKIRSHYLGEKSAKYLFVYINFAEMPSFETVELTKALFLAILTAIREHGEQQEPWTTMGKEIYAIFKEALSLNDEIVMFQSLKRAFQAIQQFNPSVNSGQAIIPIFLFDRFSEFAQSLTPDFFANLRTLRMTSGGKLAVIFSTHRPLEDLLPPHHWQDFYEFFVGNHIFLSMYDKVATNFRISVIEREYKKRLDSVIKEELVRLTGGHGKLMKLSTQILLSEPLSRKGVSSFEFRVSNFLLDHILIKGSLLEIWQALTGEERKLLKDHVSNNVTIQQFNNSALPKLALPFPLLTEFIKRNLAEMLVPKTVRLDEKKNEIYFGDESIEELTAQEFRLLKFLINNPNRVCERNEIIQAVWSDTKTAAGVSDEALDQMIHRVRKKIEDEADNPKHVLTVKGRGFRFIP